MINQLFGNIAEKDKVTAIEDLIHDSTPRPSFFFLVICSVLMATFGLIAGNASVIIGSMLIAPILSPILSLALGIVIADYAIISRSFWTLLKSTGLGLLFAIVATILFGHGYDLSNPEISSRTDSSMVYLMIAILKISLVKKNSPERRLTRTTTIVGGKLFQTVFAKLRT